MKSVNYEYRSLKFYQYSTYQSPATSDTMLPRPAARQIQITLLEQTCNIIFISL